MRGSPFSRLVVHASHYSLASLLTTLAGLVSFPLLTRVFSVADYGVMSVVGASVAIAVALGKLGVQQSVLRYHSEVCAGKSAFTLRQLMSTTILAMLASGVVAAVAVFVASRVAPESVMGERRVRNLLAIMCIVVVVQVVGSALVNITRAEMRIKLLVTYQVAKKYLGLALILGAVFLVARDLTAYYVATVVAELLAVAALGLALFRRGGLPRPAVADFSPPLYRQMLAYGIPMLFGNELAGIVLAVGDRYVIRALAGDEPLGLYSAAYNLCEYVQLVLVTSMGQAVMPIALEIWEQKGREPTAAFINQSLRGFVLFGAPVIAGVAAVAAELLPALASSKYAAATAVVPWVIAGMVVYEMSTMLGAGLFIERRTRLIMAIIMSSAALNIGLNLVLIPRAGIVGAAIATLIAYTVNSVALGAAGRAFLKVTPPWSTAARAGAASLLMFLIVSRIYPGHGLLSVAVRAVIGAAIYAAAMWAIDPDAKGIVRRILRQPA